MNSAVANRSGRAKSTTKALFGSLWIGLTAFALLLHGIDVRAQGDAKGARLRFTLDWVIEGPSSPFFLALDRGYFGNEKLNVIFEPGKGSTGAVTSVAQGRFDIGFADLNALVEHRGRNPGAPVQAVYIAYSGTPASIVTLKTSTYNTEKRWTIRGINDLKGKTLGAPGFDAARKMWPMLARANGIDPDSVKWVDVTPQRREAELLLGSVDAISGFHYTSLLNLQARGAKPEEIVVFRFVDHGVPLYGNALLVNTDFAKRNPQAVAGFVRAFNRGMRETLRNPQAALSYTLGHATLLDEATEMRRLALVLEHNVVTAETRSRGLGNVDRDRLQRSIDSLTETFKLPNRLDATMVFTDQFLPPLADREL